jgi:N-acetylmuramoyl-L-alanine amidase
MKFVTFIVALVFSISVAKSDGLAPRSPMDDQIHCLAQNIYYEARGEPDAGKYAVAEVTINRSESKSFPKTICAVVHQKYKNVCQFSWVCTKSRPSIRSDDENWQQAKMIATNMLLFDENRSIMKNHTALYFHAKNVHPSWSKSKYHIKIIGQHIFYGEKHESSV